jgi:hypothetical protein
MATTVRTRSLIGAAAPPRLLGRLNYLARIAHPAGQPASAPTEKAGGAPASAGAARASGGATKGDAPRTSNGGAGRTQGRRLRRPRAGGSQQVGDAAAAGRRRLQRRMLPAAATRPRWPEPLNTGGRQRRRPVGARSIRKAKARAEPAAGAPKSGVAGAGVAGRSAERQRSDKGRTHGRTPVTGAGALSTAGGGAAEGEGCRHSLNKDGRRSSKRKRCGGRRWRGGANG